MKGIKMQSRHGILESAILSALWSLESSGAYTNSVKEVCDIINENSIEKRAYTTIKTVMDRLYEKNILLRFKQGKKFFYRTAYSNSEMIINGLKDLSYRYCGGDINKLSVVLAELTESQRLAAV